MASIFLGIFTCDFSSETDFTCSNKVPPQFQNLNQAIKRHKIILSYLKKFDKRGDEQDVSQAAKENATY